MNDTVLIPELIGILTWKNLNGKANIREQRLLKAFTAYYKAETLHKQIEELKAQSKASALGTYAPVPFPEATDFNKHYNVPNLPKSKTLQFKKYNELKLPTEPAIKGLEATPGNLEKIKAGELPPVRKPLMARSKGFKKAAMKSKGKAKPGLRFL